MSIVDEVFAELGGAEPARREAEPYRGPSSYRPWVAFPENLAAQISEAGAGLQTGARELGEGRYAKGAWDIGMGALQGLFSPMTAGIQLGTYPLAEATGIPEPALTALPQIISGIGAARGGLGMLGRGGRMAEVAGAAGAAAEPAARAFPSRGFPQLEYQPTMPPSPREAAPQFDPYAVSAGERAEQMRRATVPIEERYAPGYRPGEVAGARETEIPKARAEAPAGPPRLTYAEPPPWEERGFIYPPIAAGAPELAAERYAPGYRPGGMPEAGPAPITDPSRLLGYQMAMPDLRPRWQRPTAEMGYLMPDESARWARPGAVEQGAYPYPRGAELPPTITDPRRMLPDYAPKERPKRVTTFDPGDEVEWGMSPAELHYRRQAGMLTYPYRGTVESVRKFGNTRIARVKTAEGRTADVEVSLLKPRKK